MVLAGGGPLLVTLSNTEGSSVACAVGGDEVVAITWTWTPDTHVDYPQAILRVMLALWIELFIKVIDEIWGCGIWKSNILDDELVCQSGFV
ncbi:hypothetical protein KCU83_g422, partial [Aureobasidium melanogenum]